MNSPDNIQTRLLVGLVGGGGSGKDSVAHLFEAQGYAHVSASDCVREEIAERGHNTSRELQTVVANEMRGQYGGNYWVDLALSTVPRDLGKIVISGLYAPEEGQHLKHELHGTLVGVVNQNSQDQVYERVKRRANGPRDTLSWQEFLEANVRENSGSVPGEANISQLLIMADYVIDNSGDLSQLRDQTLQIINALERYYD